MRTRATAYPKSQIRRCSAKLLPYKVYIIRLIDGGAWKTVGQAERVRNLIVAEMTPGRPTGEVLRAADAIVKAERDRLRSAQTTQ
jgi:hypothetical protein